MRAILACGAVLWAAAAANAAPRPAPHVALVLEDTRGPTRASVLAGLSSLGGRPVHVFEGVIVAEVPAGAEFRALRLPGVREVALGGVALAPRPRSAALPGWGFAAWNAIVRAADPGRDGAAPSVEDGDALIPPAVSLAEVRAARSVAVGKSVPRIASSSASGPFGATELNTSEFLAGAVSVNVILVESDGSIEMSTENWSADRENSVVAEIAAGLEWVRLQEPQAALSFTYHVLPGRTQPAARTGYEPIRRAADPYGATGEDLWVKQILGKLGYGAGDRFARSRALDADTRLSDGTDWAITVFVVDSLADTDGKFADNRFAYTWVGGPHIVMTYDNQAWGIDRMDQVLRHEIQHAFYAYDEYQQSACACTDHRGYLDGINANCTSCNAVADACVMIANGDAMCDATRRQVGWADLDADGTIDVVGEDPDTFLDALPAQACVIPPLTGTATVVAATNRNTFTGTPRTNISINRIAGVEVRADGAAWVAASPEDGAWGAPQERFRASMPTLSSGTHRVEARAIDDRGNVDPAPGGADVLVAAGTDPLGDTVRVARGPSADTSLTWSICAGAATYRVYRAGAPSGAWGLIGETATTSWSDVTAGAAYYRVHPVDACGDERSD